MPETNKPKLLFHVCCAPCSGILSRRLKEDYDISVYFDNPNIWPEGEFAKRAKEAEKFFSGEGVEFILARWDHGSWLECAKGLEREPEKGRRCKLCYHFRLKHAADFASKNGFGSFTTSLMISPWKDAGAIGNIGRALAKERGLEFIPCDADAKAVYKLSRDFARERGFYIQKYCGCEFSGKDAII